MKDDVRKARLAKLLGMELPVEPTPQERQLAGTISREAEAVLLYTENRNAFQVKNCKVCDEKFAVNRSSIGYCSDICRGDALGAMGIAWDPNARTLADRWSVRTGGPEPLVIREKVLESNSRTFSRIH